MQMCDECVKLILSKTPIIEIWNTSAPWCAKDLRPLMSGCGCVA